MFKKVLIANRGEIACRIIRTLKKLNISAVAIYSEADKKALHVSLADEAYLVGPPPSQESYLNIEKIIEIAKQANVEAIHPGYGFLSENMQFAEACTKNNIKFIGPSTECIRSMGEKHTAKKIAHNAGIPIIAGYNEDAQDLNTLLQAAEKITYPVLIKAVAGGGGKGMRIAYSKENFNELLESAKREAKASFNDERVLLEKYLVNPKHIEVQIFGDEHGNVVHLFERDCSIQRRHQKIIEEAPADTIADGLRQKICQAAILIAKNIHYAGAGTVEFLIDEQQKFYFLEMNTRLQVEHPVTEMITGLDLVEWQLKIAVGKKLPLTQDQISCKGHAIEVRICAEDPAKDFKPAIGKINYLSLPEHARVDTGVRQGDSINPYYDSLIAKLIAWGIDRKEALKKLEQALADVNIIGIQTNLPFLNDIVFHRSFKDVNYNTHFIENYFKNYSPIEKSPDDTIIALASLAILLKQEAEIVRHKAVSNDSFSPWFIHDNWRINCKNEQVVNLYYQSKDITISVKHLPDNYRFNINGNLFNISGKFIEKNHLLMIFNQAEIDAKAIFQEQKLSIIYDNYNYQFNLMPIIKNFEDSSENSQLVATMPGTITHIAVKKGQKVNKGDKLVVIEAMKMEHTLYAPQNGIINDIFHDKGDIITTGTFLIKFMPD